MVGNKGKRRGDGRGALWRYTRSKRVLDLLLAYLLLLVAYIPMLIIALLIKLTTDGSVIFRQIRIGAGGKSFVCYKFRTMRCDAPTNLSTAEFADADSYVTSVGRFLRRTSLDELPQLFNVLCGEMSLVGPRPLIPEEAEMHRRRHDLGVYALRPGITGLAQVRGRDEIDDAQKLSYDVEYLLSMGFMTDARILLCTALKVISADGVAGKTKEDRVRKRLRRKT
ncbi:MAG: sugar transferase [Clostridia bacterium]|nr:sugar transferase [Clostridia bacterium]